MAYALGTATCHAQALSSDPGDFVVGDIKVEGLQRIAEGTVYNYLPVSLGDRMTHQKVEESLRALYATGFFRDVELRHDGNTLIVNGQRIRLFEVEARSITIPLAAGVRFKAWSLGGRVPGPTLRARQGERIRVVFRNGDSTSHSLHFHGVHPAAMDGIEPVRRGHTAIYEFDLPRASTAFPMPKCSGRSASARTPWCGSTFST